MDHSRHSEGSDDLRGSDDEAGPRAPAEEPRRSGLRRFYCYDDDEIYAAAEDDEDIRRRHILSRVLQKGVPVLPASPETPIPSANYTVSPSTLEGFEKVADPDGDPLSSLAKRSLRLTDSNVTPEVIADLKKLDDGIHSLPQLKIEQRTELERKTLEAEKKIEEMRGEFSWQKFIAEVPAVSAKTGAPVPDWRRQQLARRRAEAARLDAEVAIRHGVLVETHSVVPEWKRNLVKK